MGVRRYGNALPGETALQGKSSSEDPPTTVRFPMTFEDDVPGSCPFQWQCSGEALVCNDPPKSLPCNHPGLTGVHGSHYLTVGNDFGKGDATSSSFYLPQGAAKIELMRSGGADAGSGLFLVRQRNGQVICAAEGGDNTNGLFMNSCEVDAGYDGEVVYISLRDRQRSSWGKVLVDNIRLKHTSGADIAEARWAPCLTTTTPIPPWNWIDLPGRMGTDGNPIIVTYAGKDKQPYIDGAVMLGISLNEHAPTFARFCMVDSSMSWANKELLVVVGWKLVELRDWHPTEEHFARGYWWDVYNKINLFRLHATAPVLYMDADMYVFGPGLTELLLGTSLEPGQIAMVKDEQKDQYNAGLILLHPDVGIFAKLHNDMSAAKGWAGLDQPLINREFRGRIVELNKTFNAHGSTSSCDTAVVAHFTGRNKPSLAKVSNLQHVKKGYNTGPPYLQCPRLYRKYYCAMRGDWRFLSPTLQLALMEAGDGGSCLSR